MNDQERFEEYRSWLINLLKEGENRYGYTLKAQLSYEMLGEVLQTRAVLSIAPIADWQPKYANESPAKLESQLPDHDRK